MIIVLNGYPGTGKLTIAQALAPRIGARLLDIHTVYNLAFALTEFKSPKFIETVEQVEAIGHGLIRDLDPDVPVVLTTTLAGDTEWGRAEWARIETLGADRPPFLVVHVTCNLEENIRRIQGESRKGARKPQDAEMARRCQAEAKPLLGGDAVHLLELETSTLSPEAAAAAIEVWVKG